MSRWVYAPEQGFAPHTTVVEVRKRLAQLVDERSILQQHRGKTAAGEAAFFFLLADDAAARLEGDSGQAGPWRPHDGPPADLEQDARPGGGLKKILPWLAALVVLLLLILLFRSCHNRHEAPAPAAAPVPAPASTPAPAPATPPVGIQKVTLPGGAVVNLAPNTLTYDLQAFLASGQPAPRRFTFDRLNFATGSAALDAAAQATVGDLAAILKAYPNARVQLEGYTDEQGTAAANQTLSDKRATAVAQALTAQGVSASRMVAKGFGESHPTATNATAGGRAQNRRTDLLVTSK